ncbi:peptidylprolyl isomerase [Streptomyces sp. NPDC008343]|uniref:peptidylprolyl isomerase n=1 Tax=Streptomyces sp. NPDC008343 TaxID=3364828 RepID=UPI0036E9A836
MREELRGRLWSPGTRRTMQTVWGGVLVVVVGASLVGATVALTGSSDKASLVDAKPQTDVPCQYLRTPARAVVGVPTFDAARASRPFTAKVVTNRGTLTLRARTAEAPCATNSFHFLASRGYFDSSRCHRLVIRDIHVLECGDPEGRGLADPGYTFPDQNLGDAQYPEGTVALSKAFPNQNGSQFFIVYADPDVPMASSWTPFAKVVDGLDVLKKVARAGTADESGDGRPADPVVIKSVTVHDAPASGGAGAGTDTGTGRDES